MIGNAPAPARRWLARPERSAAILRVLVTAVLLLSGYLAAGAVGDVFPFDLGEESLTPIVALAELPPDFPVPATGSVEYAGAGEELPYRIVWRSRRPVEEAAAVYRALLRRGRWELMLLEEEAPSYRARLARIGDEGEMTHWAMLEIEPAEGGSRLTLEFIITGSRIHFR